VRSALSFAAMSLITLRTLTESSLVPAASGAAACKPGTRIEIDYHGTWTPGQVKGAVDASGECLVGYDGYTSAWDARLPLRKIRLAGQTAPLESLPAITDELRPGNYVCTRARGSISPAFGFTAHPGRRVTDHEGRSPGTYRIDTRTRTIAFTGGGWNGRSGRFGLAESVFTHYEGEKEVVTCRPINSSKPTR